MEQVIVRPDADPQETREWLDALAAVMAAEGRSRAHYLIDQLGEAGPACPRIRIPD